MNLLIYLITYLISYLITYLITPYTKVLLDILTGFQLDK